MVRRSTKEVEVKVKCHTYSLSVTCGRPFLCQQVELFLPGTAADIIQTCGKRENSLFLTL